MDYEEAQNKFHMISGTLIAGKIFTEYAFFLKELYNQKQKGDTTRLNRLIEADAKVTKLIKYLSEDLIAIGCDLDITQNEIDKLEQTFYDVLTLSETDQKRVQSLINKIKKEREKPKLQIA